MVIGIAALTWSRPNTRDTIIKMAEKGATEPELLAAVSNNNRQALNADDVIQMKAAGVPNNVVSEMLHQSGTR